MTTAASRRAGWQVVVRALRGARRPFAFGIAGATLYAVMTVAAAYVLGRVTDEVIVPAARDGDAPVGRLAVAAAVILVVAGLKAAGVVGRRLGAYVAQYDLQSDHRRAVTRRYLELPLTWHRRHTTGELLSNANSDVEAAFFVAAPLPMSVGAAVMLVVTAGLLVATDPVLAAIGFLVGPALALVNWLLARRMRRAAAQAQQARADVSELAHESFDAAIVVKSMGREAAETARFAARAVELRHRLVTLGRIRAVFDPLVEALPSAAVLLVLLVGAWRVEQGLLSAGDLVQFAYLFRILQLPIRVFGWMLGELPRAVAGWERVEAVLGADGAMRYGDAPGGGEGGASAAMRSVGYLHPDGTTPVGDARDVSGDGAATADDDRRGVVDVTFDVAPGSTVALVGPTGAGKSTVASLLVRLYDPDTGTVVYDGRPIPQLDRDQLTTNAAIVFQEAFLFDATVRENIALGLDVTDDRIVAAARLAQADDFIRALPDGYDTLVGERGATLSGGQRQRIALARALVRRPRLLVLDDATSSVDPAVEARILDGLARADLPSTVVVVAYRRAAIELADEVVHVRDGVVVARGTHAELVRSDPAYANLVLAYDHEAREREREQAS